jgi:hypothetical protein
MRGDPDRPGKTVNAHGSTSSIPGDGHAPTIEQLRLRQSDASRTAAVNLTAFLARRSQNSG